MGNDWMNDPRIQNIDKSKLFLLSELAKQSSGKTSKDMAPFLLAAMNQAKQKGVQFNDSEIDLIISVMKSNMNKEEQKKVDKIRQLISMLNK